MPVAPPLRLALVQLRRPPGRPAARRRTQEWELDGRPLTTEVPQRPPTGYLASEQDLSIRAFTEVRDAIGGENLVDVRSPGGFTGRTAAPAHLPQKVGARLGHISTVVNLPWSKTANDGTIRSRDVLRARYADAGPGPGEGGHRVLPHRRTQQPPLARPARALGHTTAKNEYGGYLQWAPLNEMPVHDRQTAA